MTGRAVHLGTSGRPRCGHPRPFRLTADEAQVTCGNCLFKLAGGNTLGLRHPDWQLRPHGTPAAYYRHLRRGEKPCPSCQQAESRRNADYRARRAAA